MRALVTGSGGFVGRYLVSELREQGDEVVCCTSKGAAGTLQMDIMDAEQIRSVIEQTRPDVLFNLAGQANVALSWKMPQRTFSLNAIGFINILEAVRKIDPKIRLIAVGSADQYGSLEARGVNVTEEIPMQPKSPYAVSKAAQENMAQAYFRAYGMDICMVRCFNLGGADQPKGFMIPDFASGIAEIEMGLREKLLVGNLGSARDFTHVKDAAKAYRLIAEKGRSGEIYNLCSGVPYTGEVVLEKLCRLAAKEIHIEQDPSRMRPSDTPVVCGNHDKLTAHTGWTPLYGIDEIVADALSYWRDQVKKEQKESAE